MEKKTYYRTFYQRGNLFKALLEGIFVWVSNFFRIPIEVFTRRNFGERYFSFSTNIVVAVILAFIPYGLGQINYRSDFSDVLASNFTWYIYLALFLYSSWQRRQEIKHLPSVFDFERFSLSTGTLHPLLHSIKIAGKDICKDEEGNLNHRRIETLIEPAIFFFAGILLLLFKQYLGGLFIISSIFTSLSYVEAYVRGDHFMMDKIDEMICNEDLVKTFVDGKAQSDRGFSPYGRRPSDYDKRHQMYENMVEDDGFETVL